MGPLGGHIPREDALEYLREYEEAGSPFENWSEDRQYFPEDGILWRLIELYGENVFAKERGRGSATPPTNKWLDHAKAFAWTFYPITGFEIFDNWNFPLDEDTDNDGLADRQEIELGWGLFSADGDWDNLNDGEELAYGTNPFEYDTDGDVLSDGEEVKLYGTNPLLADTDGDGVDDGDEVYRGTNPLVPDRGIGVPLVALALLALLLGLALLVAVKLRKKR